MSGGTCSDKRLGGFGGIGAFFSCSGIVFGVLDLCMSGVRSLFLFSAGNGITVDPLTSCFFGTGFKIGGTTSLH